MQCVFVRPFDTVVDGWWVLSCQANKQRAKSQEFGGTAKTLPAMRGEKTKDLVLGPCCLCLHVSFYSSPFHLLPLLSLSLPLSLSLSLSLNLLPSLSFCLSLYCLSQLLPKGRKAVIEGTSFMATWATEIIRNPNNVIRMWFVLPVKQPQRLPNHHNWLCAFKVQQKPSLRYDLSLQ